MQRVRGKRVGFYPVQKRMNVVDYYFKYNNPEPEVPPIP
jgi:hypothetical protein